jgi:hypothetical protein
MSTTCQKESNARNALKSSGPKTVEGKAASRLNAVKHGLSGRGDLVPTPLAEEVARRQEGWSASLRVADAAPSDLPRAEWLARMIVTESVKIEKCQAEIDSLEGRHANSAAVRWDLDRRLNAEELALGLARRPSLVARQLRASRQGVEVLHERWSGLTDALDAPGGWTDSHRSMALDLLGVQPDFRSGTTPIDLPPVPEGDLPASPDVLREHRLALINEEVDKLRTEIVQSLDRMDDFDRRTAERGLGMANDRTAQRLHRYESEGFRRYLWASKELRSLIQGDQAVASPPASSPPKVAGLDPSLKVLANGLADQVHVPRDYFLATIASRISAARALPESEPKPEPKPEPTREPRPVASRQLNRRQRRALAKQSRR